MKTKRHAKILEIIHSTPVDTQDELLKRLRECGFDVTTGHSLPGHQGTAFN